MKTDRKTEPEHPGMETIAECGGYSYGYGYGYSYGKDSYDEQNVSLD